MSYSDFKPITLTVSDPRVLRFLQTRENSSLPVCLGLKVGIYEN